MYDQPAYRSLVIDRFHRLYYEDGHQNRTWNATYFLGVPIRKNPLDLWIYQEMLFE